MALQRNREMRPHQGNGWVLPTWQSLELTSWCDFFFSFFLCFEKGCSDWGIHVFMIKAIVLLIQKTEGWHEQEVMTKMSLSCYSCNMSHAISAVSCASDLSPAPENLCRAVDLEKKKLYGSYDDCMNKCTGRPEKKQLFCRWNRAKKTQPFLNSSEKIMLFLISFGRISSGGFSRMWRRKDNTSMPDWQPIAKL